MTTLPQRYTHNDEFDFFDRENYAIDPIEACRNTLRDAHYALQAFSLLVYEISDLDTARSLLRQVEDLQVTATLAYDAAWRRVVRLNGNGACEVCMQPAVGPRCPQHEDERQL